LELAVIAIGFALLDEDGELVDGAAGADVGDDEETVLLDDPQAASDRAAAAATATATPNRIVRFAGFPICLVDIVVLMAISSTS
jgi:hypothetical protein